MDNKKSFVYQRYRKNKDAVWLITGGLLIATLLVIYLLVNSYKNQETATVISVFAFIALIIISRFDKQLEKFSRQNYRTWGKGAGAERAVGNSLEKLGQDYKLIHDFDMGHGNVDHLCIGPTGVFVIETKAAKGVISYPGKLLIDGRSPQKDFIQQVWREIDYIRSILSQKFGRRYFVEGILQFPYAKIDQSISSQKQGIWIGGAGFANYIIKRKKQCLTPDEIKNVSDFLKSHKNPS